MHPLHSFLKLKFTSEFDGIQFKLHRQRLKLKHAEAYGDSCKRKKKNSVHSCNLWLLAGLSH